MVVFVDAIIEIVLQESERCLNSGEVRMEFGISCIIEFKHRPCSAL